MKLVTAIVKLDKIDDVVHAAAAAGASVTRAHLSTPSRRAEVEESESHRVLQLVRVLPATSTTAE